MKAPLIFLTVSFLGLCLPICCAWVQVVTPTSPTRGGRRRAPPPQTKTRQEPRRVTRRTDSVLLLRVKPTQPSSSTSNVTSNISSSSSSGTLKINRHRLISFSGDDPIPVLDDAAITRPILAQPQVPHNKFSATIESVLSTYWGPRIVLASIAAIYGTNFALGSLMNESLPAAAVTTSRMTLAAVALLPFLSRISPQLRNRAVLCGVVTAAGYVAQSLALTDTDPARVSFLGAATVLWCPLLEWAVDKIPMGWRDAPQTWISAGLCLTGVGILELYDPSGGSAAATAVSFSWDTMGGDVLALLQAVAFGTGCFLNAKMIREEPDQVLPVTAVLITVTAGLAWVWCGVESILAGTPGFLFDPVQLVTDPTLRPVALALLWTGLVSTVFNLVVEVSALGRVPSSEASVLLATEPVWAALFAAVLLGETLQINDYLGGACIIAACLVNAIVQPNDVHKLLAWSSTSGGGSEDAED